MWIEVVRELGAGLRRVRYMFSVATSPGERSIRVSFSPFHDELRESRRHRNWQVIEMWDTHERRPRLRCTESVPPSLPT